MKKHLITKKHIINADNATNLKIATNKFTCDCGKTYQYNTGLCKHKQKCNHNNNREIPIQTEENEIVSVLLKQNTIFQELILKNEEDKKEQHRKSEEEKKEQYRKSEEEKKELLMKNEEQQRKTEERENQMMDLQKQFLEAIKNGSLGNKVITVE